MNLVEALNSDYTPLAGRDMDALIDNIAWMISTHTPLAGRDPSPWMKYSPVFFISTHTPLAGRDPSVYTLLYIKVGFLLTRPSRGATVQGSSRFSCP